MCKRDDGQVVLKVPEHIKPLRVNKDTVNIDPCIAEHIRVLWDNEVRTLGCCCGHGLKELGGPTIIVDNNYSHEEVLAMYKLLDDFDSNKSFKLLQWGLSKVERLA